MKLVSGQIWCEIHGTVHEATTDPYDYGYADTGEQPECDERDWRRLWTGARIEKGA